MREDYILRLTNVCVGGEGWTNDYYCHIKPKIEIEADVIADVEIVSVKLNKSMNK